MGLEVSIMKEQGECERRYTARGDASEEEL